MTTSDILREFQNLHTTCCTSMTSQKVWSVYNWLGRRVFDTSVIIYQEISDKDTRLRRVFCFWNEKETVLLSEIGAFVRTLIWKC